MSPEEFSEILSNSMTEVELEHKLSLCGSWGLHFDVQTGLGGSRQLMCNDYRNCPPCLNIKIEDWEKAFAAIEDIFFVTVKEEDWKKVTRQWKREGRVWYQAPVEGGRIAYFDERYDGDERRVRGDFFSGPTGTKANLANAQLLTIGDILVQMPRDRRVGGKLVRLSPLKKQAEEGVERVEIEVIIAEKGKEVEAMAAVKATLLETPELDPHTAREVEEGCAIRMALLKSKLTARGIAIVSSHIEYRYVKSDAIKWRRTYLATVLHKQEREMESAFVFALESAKQQEMTLS
jgi:hypothetical protein